MISKYQLIWQLMHGQRLRYGAAVAALVLASCFLYLVPLVSSVVLDVIISDNGSGTSPFILRTVESIGGRDFVRANLWIAVALIFGLTRRGLFTYLRGRWAAEATERIIRGLRGPVIRSTAASSLFLLRPRGNWRPDPTLHIRRGNGPSIPAQPGSSRSAAPL